MSMADILTIVVKGKQTHGAQPWKGVDPVVISAEIITALQTITAAPGGHHGRACDRDGLDHQRRPPFSTSFPTAS